MADLFADLLRTVESATDHAPRDRYEYQKACADLRSRGLHPDDIAACLRLSKLGVIELLREHDESQLPQPSRPVRRRRQTW